MQVSDVLATKGREITTVQQTDIVAAAVRVLADRHIGAVVVQDRWQRLVGIFSERDLVNALARHGTEALGLTVSELMSTPVITCTATDRVDAVLARMTLNRIRHLPVLDADRLIGIISIGDLVHHRLGEKELEASVLLDISRLRS